MNKRGSVLSITTFSIILLFILSAQVLASTPKVPSFQTDATAAVKSTTAVRFNATIVGSMIGGAYVNSSTGIDAMENTTGVWQTINTTAALGCTGEKTCLFNLVAFNSTFSANTTKKLTLSVDDLAPRFAAASVNESDWMKLSKKLKVTINLTDNNLLNFTVQEGLNPAIALTQEAGKTYSVITTGAELGIVSDGMASLLVTACDAMGNCNTTLAGSIKIDESIPTIVSFSSDRKYVNSTTLINFTAVVTDTSTPSATINYSKSSTMFNIDGTNFRILNTTAQMGCSNKEGYCTFNIIATDEAGNINATQKLTLRVDDIKPKVKVILVNDSDNYVRANQPIKITVNATDDNMSTVRVNGISMTKSGSTQWIAAGLPATFSCADNSACNLIVTARDFMGNQNSSMSKTITVDSLAPSFVAPSNNETGWVKTSKALKIMVNITEANVKNVTVKIGSNSAIKLALDGGPGKRWYNITTGSGLGLTTSGTYPLTFTACDFVGLCNTTVSATTVKIDANSPIVTAVSANIMYVNSTKRINFTAYVNDTSIATVFVNYSNMASMKLVTGTKYVNVTTTGQLGCSNTEGYCAFNIIATDTAGNVATNGKVTIHVDDKKPRVTSVTVNDSDNYVRLTQAFRITANITEENISTVTVNGIPMTRVGSTVQYRVSGLYSTFSCASSGACNLNVTATDVMNNRNSTMYKTIIIDSAVPTIVIYAPANKTTITSRLVNFTINDNNAVENTSVTFSGGNYSAAYCSGMATKRNCHFLATLNAGTNVLTVTAKDRAGNLASATVSASYDNSGPAMATSLVPATTSTSPSTYVSLVYTVSDLTNVSQVWYTIDGAATKNVINKNLHLVNITAGLLAGAHTVQVYANDSLKHNNNTASMTFYLAGSVNITKVLLSLSHGPLAGISMRYKNGTAFGELNNFGHEIIEEIRLNSTLAGGINISINISFYGYNMMVANANRPVALTNLTSTLGKMLQAKFAGAGISTFFMYRNMSLMIPDSNYKNATGDPQWVKVRIGKSLGHYLVVYMADDTGTTDKVMSRCTGNVKPTTTPSVANACFTNGTNYVMLWLPHLSGGALASRDYSPDYNLTSPGTTITDSQLTFSGNILSLDLNTSSCVYNLTKGPVVRSTGGVTVSAVNSGSTNYSFSLSYAAITAFNNLTNHTRYNVSISCATLTVGNRSKYKRQFLVDDVTVPSITESTSIGTTTASVTLSTSYEVFIANVSFVAADSGTPTIVDGSTFATTQVADISGLSEGTLYNYTFKACDRAKNCNTSTVRQFTTSTTPVATPAPRSSGGGGGGGIAIGKDTTTKYWEVLNVGTNSIIVASSDFGIKRIDFNIVNVSKKVTVSIKYMAGKPTDAPELGNVYKYLQISLTNLQDSSISGSTIAFRVLKDWMTQNNVASTNIVLKRLVDGAWVDLTTTVTDSSSTDVGFSAKSPGFSYFAIAAKTTETAAPVAPTTTSEATPTAAATAPATPAETPAEQPTPTAPEAPKANAANENWVWLVVMIVLVVIALFLVSYKFFGSKGSKQIKEAKAFVEKSRASGKSDEHIASELRKAEWPEHKIHHVLKKK